MTSAQRAVVLAFREISKRFGGTEALSNVSLELRRGEVLALLGENGAGKSTLIKILAGVHLPDHGEILRTDEEGGQSGTGAPIAFIHQDLGLIEWMTVEENICLGMGYPRRFGLIDQTASRRRAVDVLAELGIAIDPDDRVESLSRTEKSLVAISRAIASKARIVVLDEPTASLPADEVRHLFAAIDRLRASGVAMIYVSHRLDEVFQIADRVVVLRDGKVAGERDVAATSPAEIIRLIVGRDHSQVFHRTASTLGNERLRLTDLLTESVGPVSCAFRSGEVVGLVGLRGAGQETIGAALFGLVPVIGGTIELDGVRAAPDSPRAAMSLGINLVWGDRNSGSIVPVLSVQENMFINPISAGLKPWSYMSPRREAENARALGSKVGLRPNQPDLPIETFSGGNQQKVVIGRWLNLRGKILMFEDPTAGVDVGAKAEIYQLFNQALADGASIILISTDFEEVANICHRALVFDRGKVVAELAGAALSVEALLSAASASIPSDALGAQPIHS
jgi:ribose transport system ATP-binding protein